ncbi:MAG: class II glutamine amidotransferase [Rhodocyclaceae bacterium]|nr:class II glutamine amidotransferase [Rhodocyclaceae bacterium]MBR4737090.1 class II glutamine amidotransferase [Rhodocyclaceae bacterium]
MCQLLAMNANTPTDIVFSFDGFRRRGGLTDCHSDGFGIAFFEGRGVRILQDTSPCATSPFADMVCQCPIRSTNIVAHIRKATQGQVTLANTHPFMRELWGQYWLFAHNGNLKNFPPPQRGTFFRPVGATDSEAAFCYLLEQLRQQFDQAPDEATLFAALTRICRDIRQYGLFNCILSNGETMFAHCASLLHYIIRQAPFGLARLSDDDVEIDFASAAQPEDRVAVIATLPLTNNEHWQQLAIDESALFKDGEIILRQTPDNPVYPDQETGLAMARAAV